MASQCEYEYGKFDKAVGIPRGWADKQGRCTFDAAGKYGQEHFCEGHLYILVDEAQRLAEFEAL